MSLAITAGLCACGGSDRRNATAGEPTEITAAAAASTLRESQRGTPGTRAADLNSQGQRELVDRVWNAPGQAPVQRREAIKQIAWQASTGQHARVRAIELLTEDATDTENADTRAMLVLLVAVEPDYPVVTHVATLATQRQWRELVPALMRALARQQSVIPDTQRAESTAIAALTGKPIVDAAFDLFATEPTGTGQNLERARRAREAAWEVMSRIDADGSQRAALAQQLASSPGGAASKSSSADNLRQTFSDLGALPLTGEQLSWVSTMREQGQAARGDAESSSELWWAQALAAVAARGETLRSGWALRHVEPARFTLATSPARLNASRAELETLLQARLRPRDRYERQPEGFGETGAGSERFDDNKARLSTPDLLALLVIDDALATKGLADELWKQAKGDMEDTSTEHGGILIRDGGAWSARAFSPAGGQRSGDLRFVASKQMIEASALSLAHYHFHAQRVRNARYAGPSPGDAEYAARHGRVCLIFTPVSEGKLNVDALFPTGVNIDLGVLQAGASR